MPTLTKSSWGRSMTFLILLTPLTVYNLLGSLKTGRGFPQECQGGQEGQRVPPLVVGLLGGEEELKLNSAARMASDGIP